MHDGEINVEQLARAEWLLRKTRVAGDADQVRRLATLSKDDQVEAVCGLRLGDASTVDEALADVRERRAAHEEAERRRGGFGTV